MIVLMQYKKDTKNTYIYEEADSDVLELAPIIPSLYIRKTAFPSGAPKKIAVTIEVDHG